MKFHHVIQTRLSSADLWFKVTSAFEDSSRWAFWPNHLETIRSEHLDKNAILEARYKFWIFSRVFHYRVTKIKAGHYFTYQTESDHPLRGGGTVQVVTRPERGGALLRWSGEYHVKSRFSLA